MPMGVLFILLVWALLSLAFGNSWGAVAFLLFLSVPAGIAFKICWPEVRSTWVQVPDEFEPLDEYTEEETETEEEEDDLVFCQLFRLTDNMSLLVHHVEMCPDENAFIRVVDDEGYTPLYKRKVRRDKRGERFIVFNGKNYYLDENKTQPIIIPE